MKSIEYLFTSERLGFRNWIASDLTTLAEINADDEVMQFFPKKFDFEESKLFMERMQDNFHKRGYCYFAVDELDSGELIGFIGLLYQEYEAHFTPCVDIGWRLSRKFWRKGYAYEGANRCLQYGFNTLKLDAIYSVAPIVNFKSEGVMKKIGMEKVDVFKHPKLKKFPRLEECILYKASKDTFK